MEVTVRSDEGLIEWGVKDTDRIIQNVRNILRTRMFEVPFMRGMGLNPDHMDSLPNLDKSGLMADVINKIKTYEGRANVLDVWIESADENGNYVVVVKMEV